jgi:hypothetical protein
MNSFITELHLDSRGEVGPCFLNGLVMPRMPHAGPIEMGVEDCRLRLKPAERRGSSFCG